MKPINNPKCLINYKLKADRDYYYDHIPGAHEGRFDIINKTPLQLTNFKRLGAPSFFHYSRRGPLFVE